MSLGVGDMWEHQARFGYQTGIAFAIHFLMADTSPWAWTAIVRSPKRGRSTRIVADFSCSRCMRKTPRSESLRRTPSCRRPSLTPRELEALRWTMDGKTAWEVGAIMSISERTAVLHLQNAMRKLGSVNKHQAVLRPCGSVSWPERFGNHPVRLDSV